MSTLLSPHPQARHVIPRFAGAAVQRARLSVVPRARERAARVPFVALVSSLLLGGVVGLLLFNTSMQQASFATTALEEQATSLSAREQTLAMELEELRDPNRLADAARDMGMVPPPAAVCFLHPDGKVTGTCGPALATDALPGPPPVVKPAVLAPEPIIEPAPRQGRDSGVAGNSAGDTTRGGGASGLPAGRTGHQPQENRQPHVRTR